MEKIKQFFKPVTNLIKRIKSVEITYKNQRRIWAAIFLAPWLIGFIILFLIPLIRSLVFSFYELTPQVGYIEQTFVGFQNYLYAINEQVTTTSSFRVELLNTTLDSLINLPVLLIFSLFIAVLLNMKFKGRAVIRAIFFIPVILNSAAVATALGGGDAIAQILEQSGIDKIFDLEFYLIQTGLGPVIVNFIVGLITRIYDILALAGVPILLFLASIQSVPKHLYEACEIDGGSKWKAFTKVTLPNIKGSISICLFTTIIGYLGLYGQVTVLTGPVWENEYDSPMQLLQYLMSSPGRGAMTGYITAVAIIFGLITMFFTAIEKYCTRDKKKGDKHAKRYYNYYAKKENA
jgi:ABC-type sugar transport system permease subunit